MLLRSPYVISRVATAQYNEQTGEAEVYGGGNGQEPSGCQCRPEDRVEQCALVLVHGEVGVRGDEGVQVRAEAHHHAHVQGEEKEEKYEDEHSVDI